MASNEQVAGGRMTRIVRGHLKCGQCCVMGVGGRKRTAIARRSPTTAVADTQEINARTCSSKRVHRARLCILRRETHQNARSFARSIRPSQDEGISIEECSKCVIISARVHTEQEVWQIRDVAVISV